MTKKEFIDNIDTVLAKKYNYVQKFNDTSQNKLNAINYEYVLKIIDTILTDFEEHMVHQKSLTKMKGTAQLYFDNISLLFPTPILPHMP